MADLPAHRWKVDGLVTLDTHNAFQYTCRKCHMTTLSGEPFSADLNRKCGK